MKQRLFDTLSDAEKITKLLNWLKMALELEPETKNIYSAAAQYGGKYKTTAADFSMIKKLTITQIVNKIRSGNLDEYSSHIGKKVSKLSGRPFKSSFKSNTIKSIIEHPTLKTPAYTFEEDDSYVAIYDCKLNN